MTLEVTSGNIKINNRQGTTKFDNSNRILFHKYVQQGSIAVGYFDTNQLPPPTTTITTSIPALGTNDFYTLDIEFTSHRAGPYDDGVTVLATGLLNKTFSCHGTVPTVFMYTTNTNVTPPAVYIETHYLFFGVVNGVLVAEIYEPITDAPTKTTWIFSDPVGVTFNYSYRVYTYG
jgi:hypothetical protein